MSISIFPPSTMELLPASSFDYTGFTEEEAEDMRATASRVRRSLRDAIKNSVQAGNDLMAIKERLGHGQFLKWIDAECHLSERTAQFHMRIARFVAEKSEMFAGLPPSALDKLAADTTPEHVRDAVAREVQEGRPPTVAAINKMIRHARAEPRQKTSSPAPDKASASEAPAYAPTPPPTSPSAPEQRAGALAGLLATRLGNDLDWLIAELEVVNIAELINALRHYGDHRAACADAGPGSEKPDSVIPATAATASASSLDHDGIPGELRSLDPECFVLEVDDADRDLEQVKAEVLAMRPTAKGVAKKFDNLILGLAGREMLSEYTIIGAAALHQKQSLTMDELVATFEAMGYTDGTQRNEARHVMILLPLTKIAIKSGDKLTENPDSVAAFAIREIANSAGQTGKTEER